MGITVPVDSLQVHIGSWLYRLRLAEAHLESRQAQLDWSMADEFTLELIKDLLGACEDAASFVSSQVECLEAAEEADLGKERL